MEGFPSLTKSCEVLNQREDDTSSQENVGSLFIKGPQLGSSCPGSGVADQAATVSFGRGSLDPGAGGRLTETLNPTTRVESASRAIEKVDEPVGPCASLELASHEAKDSSCQGVEQSFEKIATKFKESVNVTLNGSQFDLGHNKEPSPLKKLGKEPSEGGSKEWIQCNSSTKSEKSFRSLTQDRLTTKIVQGITILEEHNAKAEQTNEPGYTSLLRSKKLADVAALALTDLIHVLKNRELQTKDPSYTDMVEKFECAKLIFTAPEPFNEKPYTPFRSLDDHTCELAFDSMKQLDPKAVYQDLFKATNKVRSCKLQALAGLCLHYANSGSEPDWELLATLWQEAKTASKSNYGTSFLGSIKAARTNLLIKEKLDSALSAIKMSAGGANSISFNQNLKDGSIEGTPSCRICHITFKPELSDEKGYRQWIHLNYQVADKATHEWCKQSSPLGISSQDDSSPIRISTHNKKLITRDILAEAIPSLVSRALNSQLFEETTEKIKPTKCPHDLEHWSEAWADAKGALDPSFSAIIFIGSPNDGNENPLMLINEEMVFQWTNELDKRALNLSYEVPMSPGIFIDPFALRHYSRVISTEKIHQLTVHSTGASSYLCQNKPHEKRRWVDNLLPLEVITCRLGQEGF